MHFDKEIIDLSWQKTEKSREGKDLEIQKTLGDMTTLVNVLHIHGGTCHLWVHTGVKYEHKFPQRKCFLLLQVRDEKSLAKSISDYLLDHRVLQKTARKFEWQQYNVY